MKLNPRTRRQAFTLLEMVLALAIGLLLMTAVYFSLDIYLKTTQAGRKQIDQEKVARGVVKKLTDDVTSNLAMIPMQTASKSKGSGGGSGGSGGSGGRGQRQRQRVQRGADLEAQVSISFDQAIAGAQVPLQVPMHTACETCHGTGAKPGTTPTVCPRCEGRGIETQGQGMFSISQPCSRCHGSGTVIEDPCPTCHGTGAVRTVKRLRVNLPAGVRDGSRIRLAGKGEAGPQGGPPGDLYLIVHVSSSPVFRRKGDNLEVEVPLSIPEALRGAEVKVPTLDGIKTLRVPPGTKHGTVQRLRGEGPTKPGSAKGGSGPTRGDIRYRFVIDVPKELDKEQQAAVDALSQVLDGNPRAQLFKTGSASADGGRS
jgi:molecular chaperone DnaJ